MILGSDRGLSATLSPERPYFMLKLHAFGDPYLVSEDGTRLHGLARQTKRFALLIYLVCDDRSRPFRRDELVATFWPEADDRRGRNALRQSLFVIRDELHEEVISTNGNHELWVERTAVDSDVAAFMRAIDAGRFEEALSIYRADFLASFNVPDCPELDAWIEERRVNLQGIALSAAKNLAHVAEGDRDLSAALHWWRRASSLRPFDEAIIRRIMSLLAGSGNRGAALTTFERFDRQMMAELGLRPSWDTLELADTISVSPPENITQWIGDRRRKGSPQAGRGGDEPTSHWRRPSDEPEI